MVAQCSDCSRATAYCSHSAIQEVRGETQRCGIGWRKCVSKFKGEDEEIVIGGFKVIHLCVKFTKRLMRVNPGCHFGRSRIT